MSLSWQFSEDGILSKLWAEKCLIIASLILIFTSNDSANLRNFKKTENFQKISFLNLITVNILKKSEYWLNIQPVSVSMSRRAAVVGERLLNFLSYFPRGRFSPSISFYRYAPFRPFPPGQKLKFYTRGTK